MNPTDKATKAVYANWRELARIGVRQLCLVFWLTLFIYIGLFGCAVALLADAFTWCEDKLRDALGAIEDHL